MLRNQETELASLKQRDTSYLHALIQLSQQQEEFASAYGARLSLLADQTTHVDAKTSAALEQQEQLSHRLLHDVKHELSQRIIPALAVSSDQQPATGSTSTSSLDTYDRQLKRVREDIIDTLKTIEHHKRRRISEAQLGHDRLVHLQHQHDDDTDPRFDAIHETQPTVEEPSSPETTPVKNSQLLLAADAYSDFPTLEDFPTFGELPLSTTEVLLPESPGNIPPETDTIEADKIADVGDADASASGEDNELDARVAASPVLSLTDDIESHDDNDSQHSTESVVSDGDTSTTEPNIAGPSSKLDDDSTPLPDVPPVAAESATSPDMQYVPTDRKHGVLEPGTKLLIDVNKPRTTRSMTRATLNRLTHFLNRHHSLLHYVHRLEKLDQQYGAPLTSFGGTDIPRVVRRRNRKLKSPHSVRVAIHRLHRAVDDNRRRLKAHPEYGKLVVQAEIDEIEKLKNMKVYIERQKSDIPKDAVIIGSRFVHTVDESDKKSNGKVKARCVAQGFRQPIGPEETYSPVILPDSLRAFVMSAVSADMMVKQMDVLLAYLHAELDTPVFIKPPRGVPGLDENAIWECTKALYGLKNSGKAWYETFRDKLIGYGLQCTESDQGLFTKETDRGTMQVALYVDDLLVSFHDERDFIDFKTYMGEVAKIKIKDLGDMSEFCGIEFTKVDGGYSLHQSKYINDLLVRFDKFITSHRQKVPINPYVRKEDLLRLDDDGVKLYQELLGCYNWLAGNSRPDIGYAVSKFASFTQDATEKDLEELQKMLMYLRDTKEFTIDILKSHYPDRKVKLYAFSDASFANEEERKSRTGYIIYVNGTPMGWRLKKQTLVTTSTFASEYVALSHTTTDLLWMKGLFHELGMETIEVPKILEDNNGVVLSVNGTGSSPSNTKSVDIKEKHIRNRIQRGEVQVEYIGTEDNVADAFTKPLSYVAFGRHFPYLGFDKRFAIRLIAIRLTC